jgi:hypothetical protein
MVRRLMDFWVACGIALLVGFAIGRWWAIAAVALGWTIYALSVIPQHIEFAGNEAGLGPWLENAQYINVFLNVAVLGTSTALGFGCRLLSRAWGKEQVRQVGLGAAAGGSVLTVVVALLLIALWFARA